MSGVQVPVLAFKEAVSSRAVERQKQLLWQTARCHGEKPCVDAWK
ncbi:MAG TPA: hypothetical protein V6C98_17030 [Thermosynechococcaceae cyanobacterium]